MTLQTLLDKRASSPYPARCRVELVRRDMSKKDAEALVAAIDNPTVMATAISAAVKEFGMDLTEKSIYRHRKGQCRCGY